MFLYILARRPEIEAHWIADTETKAEAIRSLGYPAITYANQKLQQRAGVYVVNQVKEIVPERLRGAVLLNLWHGVGVKQIERKMRESHLLPRIATKYIKNNKTYRDSMMLLVTSPLMEEHFQAQIDPLPPQIIRADYPQNSVPKIIQDVKTFDHDIRKAKNLGEATRVAVWAPTYRLTGNDGFVATALPDVERLIDVLERSGQLLILKMHPQLMSDPSYRHLTTNYASHPRLLFWKNEHDFYEIFDQIDTAIIDYSSIHYDLIAGGVKKYIRYTFDIGQPGVLEAGLDYESMSVGTLASDFDSLLRAIEEDNTVAEDALTNLTDAFWAYREGTTPDTIIEAALSYQQGDVDLPTLYTFDIFDTVIHRRGVVPHSIFLGLRDRLLREGDHWPAFFAAQFDEIRAQAENAVREAKRKDPRRQETKRFEISLEEIYERIATVYGLSSEDSNRVQAWEIELELEDVIPDVDMIQRVCDLREAGEKVLFISDMYLPRAVIEEMLRKADSRLAGIPVFLSEEHGVQKSTGMLYAYVFAEVGYDYAKWIHVGDNPHADKAMPLRLGIEAQPIAPTTLDETELFFLDQARNRDAALIAGRFRQKRIQGASRVDLFAYRNLAGLLVPYVMWMVDDAVRRGYETLYFVARDGHFLKIIADAYITANDLDLKSRYIYGSRRSWRLASQRDALSIDMFAAHGLFGGVRNLEAVASQAHTSLDELIDIVPELARWTNTVAWNNSDRSEVLRLLQQSPRFHGHLLNRAREENRLAQDYFRQEVDFSEKFAFVDYWGRGLTQDCLVDIFRSMGDVDPSVTFYYARSIYKSEGDSIRHNFTSASYPLTLVELILANQPHGTTLGYAVGDDGKIIPVYEERECNEPVLHATEKMIAEFTYDVLRTPLVDRDGALREVFRFSFEHFRQHPTHPDYVEFLAPLRDSVTMGDKEREFAPRLTLREYVSFLRTLRSDELTRSLPISLRRSTGSVRLLAALQAKVGFRRWLLALRTRRSRDLT